MDATNKVGKEETMEDEGEGGTAARRRPNWLPPAADAAGEHNLFGRDFEEHFWVPARLTDKSMELVETANDFHYAMVNDHPRNEFYRQSLKAVVSADTHVLEIGTGSGLLAMIAAQCGAKMVTAVEANHHMAALARRIIAANGLSERVRVINKLSTDLVAADLAPHGPADVLLSEILGTLMLGESALEYNADARDRGLLKPGGKLVPAAGKQYVQLVESADLENITSVKGWGGLDLSGLNVLQDTASLVFTKQYGFRFSSVPHRLMTDKIVIADVNFSTDAPGFIAKETRHRVTVKQTGIIHAALMSWEVSGDDDESITMSTDPEATRDNFARDMQWGQGLQLLEDVEATAAAAAAAPSGVGASGAQPVPFRAQKGEELELVVRFSHDSVVVQVMLERLAPPAGAKDDGAKARAEAGGGSA